MEDKGLLETGDGDAGARHAVADIFVCHTRDAAHDAGIALKPYH